MEGHGRHRHQGIGLLQVRRRFLALRLSRAIDQLVPFAVPQIELRCRRGDDRGHIVIVQFGDNLACDDMITLRHLHAPEKPGTLQEIANSDLL